jgi:hypothetical protein
MNLEKLLFTNDVSPCHNILNMQQIQSKKESSPIKVLYFLLFLPLLISITSSTEAQTVKGSWFGKGEVMLEGQNNNYLLELILKQKGTKVEGILGYYYKSFYQTYFVTGKYNPKTRAVTIKDFPIIYFNANTIETAVHCTMNLETTLSVTSLKSSLKGYFISNDDYKYLCPVVNLSLYRDENDNTDSALLAAKAMQKYWEPNKDVTVEKTIVQERKPVQFQTEIKKFNARKYNYIKDITVSSDSLRISLFDNGYIDGDTVSIFYNKVPIIRKQGLSAEGQNFYLVLDKSVKEHELSMFSENLGSIPPNTALMIINDGVNRYEVFLTSTLTTNGIIRIRTK